MILRSGDIQLLPGQFGGMLKSGSVSGKYFKDDLPSIIRVNMKKFKRNDPLLSMCGLNCGLCTMRIAGHCPGCGQGNRPCKIARCGMEHNVEYCFECSEYPCRLYNHADEYDSFITHINQKADMAKAKEIGTEAYCSEQKEKVRLLETLLGEYDAGRQKTLFALAVNLLPIRDVRGVLDEAESLEMSKKDMAKHVSQRLRQIAEGYGIELKLRKKGG